MNRMVLDEAVRFVFSVYGHVEIIFSDGNVDSESSLISFSCFHRRSSPRSCWSPQRRPLDILNFQSQLLQLETMGETEKAMPHLNYPEWKTPGMVLDLDIADLIINCKDNNKIFKMVNPFY